MTPTQAIDAIRQLIADYEDVPDPTDENGQAVISRAKEAIAALAAAAEVPSVSKDFPLSGDWTKQLEAATIERCVEKVKALNIPAEDGPFATGYNHAIGKVIAAIRAMKDKL